MGPALGAGGGAPFSLENGPLGFSTHIVPAVACAGLWLSSLGSRGSQPGLSIRITEGLVNPPHQPPCQVMAQWPGVKLATGIL